MNELEFFRGIEGEEQQGSDLTAGAEHLVRLKIQSGQQTQPKYEDLELKKEAGELAEIFENMPPTENCKNCGKEKTACFCPPRMSKDKTAAYQNAKAALKELMRTNPTARAAILGGAVGAAGNAAYGATQAPPGHRLSTAVRSGVTGGILGAGTGALYQHLNSKVASSPDWNKTMLAATTGLGALAGGVGTYLSSRPQQDTGKSKMEEDLEGQVLANKSKPERGFLHKLKNRETESAHGIAQVFREHPNKAALLGLLTGAAGGYGIGQLGGAIIRRRGGQ